MMAERPLRLRVQDALTEVIRGVVRTTGPYQYDLAEAVFRGRLIFGPQDPEYMVSVLEPPLPPDPALWTHDTGDTHGDWDLMIQGFVLDDPEHPTDPAHFLMADVKAALVAAKRNPEMILAGNPDHELTPHGPSVVTDLRIGAGVVRPGGGEEGISDKAFFYLALKLSIAEDLEEPFA